MKQTAVEWLVEQMIERKFFVKNTPLSYTTLEHLTNKAKAMEKGMMSKNANFICHGCGTKHTGENDDQMYEVCKQCFINL